MNQRHNAYIEHLPGAYVNYALGKSIEGSLFSADGRVKHKS